MLLQDKNAIVYGAAGAIGSTVARTFAAEGATVFLAGRTQATLDVVAEDIEAAGGRAFAAMVDALDEQAVRAHVESVAARAGSVDVSFNAIGVDHVQEIPLLELSLEEFTLPITTYVDSLFLTATAAGRQMARQGSGVVVTLSTTAARVTMATGGFGAACSAVEGLSRTLAGGLGPQGVRVVCVRSDGISESVPHGSHTAAVWARVAERVGVPAEDVYAAPGVPGAVLGRGPTLAEVADVVAFLASDRAGGIAADVVNVTCGSVFD